MKTSTLIILIVVLVVLGIVGGYFIINKTILIGLDSNNQKSLLENTVINEGEEEQEEIEESESQENVQNRMPVILGEYEVLAGESMLGWSGRKPFLEGYINSGTVPVKEGSITVQSEGTISGRFTIDMENITTGLTMAKPGAEKSLTEHLKGEGFFNVKDYPEAYFVITKSEKKNNFLYSVEGDLTLLAETHPVSFDAQAFVVQNENGENILTVESRFNIDRTKWGLTIGSGTFFEALGSDRIIADEILLELLLTAKLYE
jgi:polyisoprenoid-binding protein YceI